MYVTKEGTKRLTKSSHGRPNEQPSETFLQAHTNATAIYHNSTNLGEIKWGRIDYITEWQLCTSWLLFKWVPCDIID